VRQLRQRPLRGRRRHVRGGRGRDRQHGVPLSHAPSGLKVPGYLNYEVTSRDDTPVASGGGQMNLRLTHYRCTFLS
jgi:hypothetical protein